MAITNMTTGDLMPWTTTPWEGGGTTIIPETDWTVAPNITFTTTPPNCTEAITILEEAEYELKELLKKTPSVVLPVIISGKTHQDQIVIALRSTQAALRALLKIGV